MSANLTRQDVENHLRATYRHAHRVDECAARAAADVFESFNGSVPAVRLYSRGEVLRIARAFCRYYIFNPSEEEIA